MGSIYQIWIWSLELAEEREEAILTGSSCTATITSYTQERAFPYPCSLLLPPTKGWFDSYVPYPRYMFCLCPKYEGKTPWWTLDLSQNLGRNFRGRKETFPMLPNLFPWRYVTFIHTTQSVPLSIKGKTWLLVLNSLCFYVEYKIKLWHFHQVSSAIIGVKKNCRYLWEKNIWPWPAFNEIPGKTTPLWLCKAGLRELGREEGRGQAGHGRARKPAKGSLLCPLHCPQACGRVYLTEITCSALLQLLCHVST